MTTKKQAQAWVDEAKQGFITAEKALTNIINHKAWVPLGYKTFSDLYETEFAGLQLAGEARAAAVYALLDGGATDTEIATTIIGVSVAGARTLRSKKNAGVSADKASRTVVRHTDRKTGETKLVDRKANQAYISFPTTAEFRAEVIAVAEQSGMSLEEFAQKAVEAWVSAYGGRKIAV